MKLSNLEDNKNKKYCQRIAKIKTISKIPYKRLKNSKS